MERPGFYVTTVSGRQFWPLDPREEEMDIGDIAHALSMQCRYNGHIDRFYSVAEHSVLCSHVVRPELALEALLHDAAEAWIGDLVSPVKRLETIAKPFKEIEHRIETVLARKFGLSFPFPAEIKEADEAVLHREVIQMRPPEAQNNHQGRVLPPPANVGIIGWPPGKAKWMFLNRFGDLTLERSRRIAS